LVVIGGGIAYLLWKRKKNKEEEISSNTAPTSADTPSAATPSATPASSGTPSSTPASAGTPPKSGTKPKDFIYSPSTDAPTTVAPNQAKGFPVGSVIVPKIPLLYLDLLLVDGKTSIGQVKKATTIALVNSPNWLYVKAMVQQPNGFPVEKRGYIKTNTAQLTK
jgi:hypothetical protein